MCLFVGWLIYLFAWLCVLCFSCSSPGNWMWGKTICLQANRSADPGQQLSPSCHKWRETTEKWAAATWPYCDHTVLMICSQLSKVFFLLAEWMDHKNNFNLCWKYFTYIFMRQLQHAWQRFACYVIKVVGAHFKAVQTNKYFSLVCHESQLHAASGPHLYLQRSVAGKILNHKHLLLLIGTGNSTCLPHDSPLILNFVVLLCSFSQEELTERCRVILIKRQKQYCFKQQQICEWNEVH